MNLEEIEDEEDDEGDDDDESLNLSEGAKRRMIEEEMKNVEGDEEEEDDDDDESDEEEGEVGSGQGSDSFEEDIANRSLNAEDEDELVVIESMNYLKYVSDRFNQQTDILEIVDKNERSFKQLAEKMIFQTSYLVQQQTQSESASEDGGHGGPTGKRLMHFKHLPSISDTFHNSQSKNGFPYAISVRFEIFKCASLGSRAIRGDR